MGRPTPLQAAERVYRMDERAARALSSVRARCGHRAVFLRHGFRGRAASARRDHPLCIRCWRAERSRAKAVQMAAAHERRLAFVPGPFALL